MFDLASVQAAIGQLGFDGWLLYDFRGLNVLARRVLGIPGETMLSRRWFYYIPAQGEPRSDGRTSSTPMPPDAGPRLTLREFRDRAERRYIVEVLGSLEWNISRAAVILGIERTNLHKKIRAYGIKRGEGA